MRSHDLVFGIGPAGTGKTYLAAAYGAHLLFERRVERLILARPALEAGERLGLSSRRHPREDRSLSASALRRAVRRHRREKCMKLMETGIIEIAPLAFMRGRTLSHAFVILDEAQNCTPAQMKMCLTRLGEESRMVITGDPSQSDLPAGPQGSDRSRRLSRGRRGRGRSRASPKPMSFVMRSSRGSSPPIRRTRAAAKRAQASTYESRARVKSEARAQGGAQAHGRDGRHRRRAVER